MRPDARPAPIAIHASAVAIGERGLLIMGRSRAGKSRLACALIAAATRHCPIVLVGDDRILLDTDRRGRLAVRPHPRIAGFIERRGLGIVAMPYRDRAVLGGLLRLGDDDDDAALPLCNLPQRAHVVQDDPVDVVALLGWWHGAARRRQGAETRPALASRGAKD